MQDGCVLSQGSWQEGGRVPDAPAQRAYLSQSLISAWPPMQDNMLTKGLVNKRLNNWRRRVKLHLGWSWPGCMRQETQRPVRRPRLLLHQRCFQLRAHIRLVQIPGTIPHFIFSQICIDSGGEIVISMWKIVCVSFTPLCGYQMIAKAAKVLLHVSDTATQTRRASTQF